MEMFGAFDRSTKEPPSRKTACRLAAELRQKCAVSIESRSPHDESAVVVRESFAEPQRVRHVRAAEIERLDLLRPQPLHVPRVKKLVSD
jgi:hypothetical protein